MRGKKYSEEEIKYIESSYGKITYKDMAEVLGRTPAAVKRAAYVYCSIPTVATGTHKFSRHKRTYDCNDDFFYTSTSESDYWAGFIAADGCILDKSAGYKALQITLAAKDEEHIVKFMKAINFNGVIQHSAKNYIYKGVTSLKHQVLIRVCSDVLCEDLITRYGVTPRKTSTYQLYRPSEINFWAFLRGYIDGDGSIEQPIEGKKWGAQLSLLGTPEFLELVCALLPRAGVNSYTLSKRYERTHALIITGRESIKLLRKLSEQETPVLGRKWKDIAWWCENYRDPRIVFTAADIVDIEARLHTGEKQSSIAKDYGVHQVTISNVNLGKHTTQVNPVWV